MSDVKTKPKAAPVPTLRSGFCNRFNPFDLETHRRCRLGECVCECHTHYSAFWVGWDDEPKVQNGFDTEGDAYLFLRALAVNELISPDASTDVVPYRGEPPW